MRLNRTVDEAVPTGTVHGLGVSDALRLKLQPVQIPWLVDELEEIRGPLEETLRIASANSDAEVVEEVEYRLRLLRKLRGELPEGEHGEFVLFTGPSGMVLDAVEGTMDNVVAALAEQVARRKPNARLRDTAAAAHAWVETFLDCKAVEGFDFDPTSDPIRPG